MQQMQQNLQKHFLGGIVCCGSFVNASREEQLIHKQSTKLDGGLFSFSCPEPERLYKIHLLPEISTLIPCRSEE